MPTKQITVERFSVVSAKPFAEVVRAIEAQVGHPEIKQFYEAIHEAEDDHELQRVVNDAIGPSDLMEFMRFDQGAVLRRTTKTDVPANCVTIRLLRFLHEPRELVQLDRV